MPTINNPGRWKRAFFLLLGDLRGRNFLAKRVLKHTANFGPFTFPIDGVSLKRMLLILPADRLQTLYQIDNASALIARYPDARVTLLAESSVMPLAAMIGADEVVEYFPEEKQLFAPAFAQLSGRFQGELDCCCLLTRKADLPLQYFTGLTGAQLRVGYGGAADFPFINLRIDPSPDNRYLPESNCAMAEALGATDCGVWTRIAAGSTTAEIDHLFREVCLNGVRRLIGIDVLSLFGLFGEKGAKECISALMTFANGGLYFYCEEVPPRAIAGRLAAMMPPLFSALTIPQTIALLRRTECIVAGNTLFFGLATLLGKKAVGVFSDEDLSLYCKPFSMMKGIHCFGKRADVETLTAMVAAVRELLDR
jgi:hypothetical protein